MLSKAATTSGLLVVAAHSACMSSVEAVPWAVPKTCLRRTARSA